MALRSVLGKLGNISVRTGGRGLVGNKFHRIWDDWNYQDELEFRAELRRETDGIPRRYPRPGPVRHLPHAQPTDNPKIMALAHLAVEEFNKQKKTQLQFTRAVKAYRQSSPWVGNTTYYYLTLEAVDAEVVKTYQAIVCEDGPGVELYMFGLVADNVTRSLLKLIEDEYVCYSAPDNRDDRPDDGESINESREIKVAMQTREGYTLEDEILDSLHALPFQ